MIRHRLRWFAVWMPALLWLAACSDSAPGRSAPGAAPVPVFDPAQVARGAEVFRAHCAACHGDRAKGAPNWQKAGADGKYPPPPLDGSAHAWHHPTAVLKDVIRNGTQRIGGNMPPWRDKLGEPEIEAVIAYFQSLWPAEIYQAWADIDRRARAGDR